MNRNRAITVDRDALLDNLAADLTDAAYPIALRHRRGDSWVDLELDLWKALSAAVKKWERKAGIPVST